MIEKARIPADTFQRLLTLLALPNSPLAEIPVDHEICQQLATISRSDIPDLPDRLIAATARYLNVPIISRDSQIQASELTTIW